MSFIAQHLPETVLTVVVAIWVGVGVVAWAYNIGLGSSDDR